MTVPFIVRWHFHWGGPRTPLVEILDPIIGVTTSVRGGW